MNFRKLPITLDVSPLLQEIEKQPEIWSLDTFWKDFPIPIFREVDTIYLRFPDKQAFKDGYGDVNTCLDQPAFNLLPARPLVDQVFKAVSGKELGRVMINRLLPSARVLPHSDGQNLYFSRYHVVLTTNHLVDFRCGQEHGYMRAGEVWWFNNSEEHEVTNYGDTPRIHLIADIRT